MEPVVIPEAIRRELLPGGAVAEARPLFYHQEADQRSEGRAVLALSPAER